MSDSPYELSLKHLILQKRREYKQLEREKAALEKNSPVMSTNNTTNNHGNSEEANNPIMPTDNTTNPHNSGNTLEGSHKNHHAEQPKYDVETDPEAKAFIRAYWWAHCCKSANQPKFHDILFEPYMFTEGNGKLLPFDNPGLLPTIEYLYRGYKYICKEYGPETLKYWYPYWHLSKTRGPLIQFATVPKGKYKSFALREAGPGGYLDHKAEMEFLRKKRDVEEWIDNGGASATANVTAYAHSEAGIQHAHRLRLQNAAARVSHVLPAHEQRNRVSKEKVLALRNQLNEMKKNASQKPTERKQRQNLGDEHVKDSSDATKADIALKITEAKSSDELGDSDTYIKIEKVEPTGTLPKELSTNDSEDGDNDPDKIEIWGLKIGEQDSCDNGLRIPPPIVKPGSFSPPAPHFPILKPVPTGPPPEGYVDIPTKLPEPEYSNPVIPPAPIVKPGSFRPPSPRTPVLKPVPTGPPPEGYVDIPTKLQEPDDSNPVIPPPPIVKPGSFSAPSPRSPILKPIPTTGLLPEHDDTKPDLATEEDTNLLLNEADQDWDIFEGKDVDLSDHEDNEDDELFEEARKAEVKDTQNVRKGFISRMMGW